MAKRTNEENIEGGSRAAKKRAKKRKQQQLKKQINIEEIIEQVVEEVPKKKKLQLLLSDDDEKPKDKVKKTKKTKKKKEKKDVEDKSEDAVSKSVKEDSKDAEAARNEDIDSNPENEVINEILSELNPIEILFPERLIEVEDGEEDGEPNPLVLIQHLETKQRARAVFESILAPSGISVEEFYKDYWEKQPLLISKSRNFADLAEEEFVVEKHNEEGLQQYRTRFHGILSKKKIEELISNQPMRYGRDLNVTNFCKPGHGEKRRITLDQIPEVSEGQEEDVEYITAESNDVWQNFETGCTVRLLCPQKHNDEVHALLSNMEHEFGCMVGSNAYLTPGGTENQGFAPHYDDIEAFVLQLEGYKHWKVYPPMSKAETLPRESSRDFTDKDMEDAEPEIDIELGPGDVLYMPRGWVHEANTCRSKHHSLHLTMSANQNWSWVDFLENIMPEALEAASSKSTSLRSGLPRNFLSYMGTMHEQFDLNSKDAPEALKQLASKVEESNDDDVEEEKEKRRMAKMQEAFKAEAKKKIMRVCKEALDMVTSGCDEISKRFLSDRLPPAFTLQELALTSDNRAENGGKIWPNTMVRLAKPGIAHLVIENDKAVLYHSVDNSRVYHETPLSPMEFEVDDAPALEALLTTVEPHWICVQDLIHGDIEDKMEIAQSLYDEGILAMFQEEKADTTVQTG